MKKSIIALFALALSTASLADHKIQPRAVSPAIALTDRAALTSYLTDLVYESEEDTQELTIYEDDAQPEELCQVKDAGTAECELDYTNDRWNGQLFATFKLSADGAKIVRLTKVVLDGSY